MGISLAKPCPKTLINEYIVGLSQFPDNVHSGEDIYEYYKGQSKFEEISIFNDIRYDMSNEGYSANSSKSLRRPKRQAISMQRQ
jgi:hypothetical protein